MATEWFIQNGEQELGPFTVKQLRAQAAAKRIQPDTKVRRGQRGKWYRAKNVKGLLSTEVIEAANTGEDAKPSAPQARKIADAPAAEDGVYMVPVQNRKRRAIIFGIVVVFILIGQAPLHKQLFFDLTVGLIIGSYPILIVREKTIEQQIYLFFFKAHTKSWKLRDFVGVEAEMESRLMDQYGCLIVVFFWWALLWRLFDFLMPWIGGTYKLYLREYNDEKMLIWQGSNERDYEANLALLNQRGLPIL